VVQTIEMLQYIYTTQRQCTFKQAEDVLETLMQALGMAFSQSCHSNSFGTVLLRRILHQINPPPVFLCGIFEQAVPEGLCVRPVQVDQVGANPLNWYERYDPSPWVPLHALSVLPALVACSDHIMTQKQAIREPRHTEEGHQPQHPPATTEQCLHTSH
jgi:hypothetical protein